MVCLGERRRFRVIQPSSALRQPILAANRAALQCKVRVLVVFQSICLAYLPIYGYHNPSAALLLLIRTDSYLENLHTLKVVSNYLIVFMK